MKKHELSVFLIVGVVLVVAVALIFHSGGKLGAATAAIENVKCVFRNSNSMQKCYLAGGPVIVISPPNKVCYGVKDCTLKVKSQPGGVAKWKSSCGDKILKTVVDGKNDVVKFDCTPARQFSINVPLDAYLGSVATTVEGDQWSLLSRGSITTDVGSTDYYPILWLGSHVPSCKPVYAEDEREELGNFLYCNDGDGIFEYEIVFEQGLKSKIENGMLASLIGKKLKIFGNEFTIMNAGLTANTVSLELSGPFALGIKDNDFTDNVGYPSVWINNGETIEDATINMFGTVEGDVFTLEMIRYQLTADAILGDVFIPVGGSLRQQLDEPEGTLGFDIYLDSFSNNIATVGFGVSP